METSCLRSLSTICQEGVPSHTSLEVAEEVVEGNICFNKYALMVQFVRFRDKNILKQKILV